MLCINRVCFVQLQLEKKTAESLKNVHMFVSLTRLSIHNLPKSYDDRKLKLLFMEAAGVNKYKIKQVLCPVCIKGFAYKCKLLF